MTNTNRPSAHKLVSHAEWVAARKKHLAKEKDFTQLRDQLSRERRELPSELVEKDYRFAGEQGNMSLHDLFARRGQLVIYHGMFNPDTAGPETTWTTDAACFSCSWWMDNFNGITVHLNHRGVTMVAVSPAPFEKLIARMAAVRTRWRRWLALGPKALETGGRLDERAIHAEVLIAQQVQPIGSAE